ncbi:MAG: PAS domain-containing protein [Ignavibacteria bacterium]|nr:PAS domain-containing protein [Ignavibacteria bacterium]
MQKTIRILIFDETDQLSRELQQLQVKFPEIDIHHASHINDLILSLDDFQPHIVVVNDKLSTYESLTALALLKRRRPGVPHILYYDRTQSIREIRQIQLDFNSGVPNLAPLVHAVDEIIEQLSEQQFSQSPVTFESLHEAKALEAAILKEYCDLYFILTSEQTIESWGRNEFSPIQLPKIDIIELHIGRILPSFLEKQGTEETLNSLLSRSAKEFEIHGDDEKKGVYSVKIIPLQNGRRILTFQDLSAVRQTEIALIERTRLLEVLPWAIVTLNLDDKIVFINREGVALTGKQKEYVTGKSFEEAFPVVFPNENPFEIKRTVFTEGSWSGAVYLAKPDLTKELYTLRVIQLKNLHDKVTGLIFIMQKNTENRTVNYQQIIENIAEALFILANDKIVYANETFGKLLGYTIDELLDQSIFYFLDKEDVASFTEKYSEIKEFLEPEHLLETKFVHKNGINRVYCDLRLNVMQNPSGMSILGVARDVTEKKLHDLLFQNESKPAAPVLGTNTQDLKDHDFRTYLNAILGFADILRDRFREYYDDQNLFLYAEQIHSAGQRMLRLMEDNPAVTELAASRAGVVLNSLSLPEFVNESLGFINESTAGVKFSVQHHTKFKAMADKRFLQEAFQLLIANSAENSRGGFILIDSGYDMLKNMVFLRIKDSSEGIDENVLPLLFNPIIDNPSIISDALKATAETFVKAKRLMHIMSGRLEVQSSRMKGVNMTLFLPCDEQSKSTETQDQKSSVFYTVSPELLYLNELRPYFLIIEDDPGSSKMLEITLKSISRLDIASNGYEALELIEKNHLRGVHYDLLLLDIGLPDPWDGMSLRKHIIETYPVYRQIPFIAETAFVTRTEKEKIIESGFDGFISKPIDRRFLIKTLTSTLKRVRGEQ